MQSCSHGGMGLCRRWHARPAKRYRKVVETVSKGQRKSSKLRRDRKGVRGRRNASRKVPGCCEQFGSVATVDGQAVI